jgi:hypothetical protein
MNSKSGGMSLPRPNASRSNRPFCCWEGDNYLAEMEDEDDAKDDKIQ